MAFDPSDPIPGEEGGDPYSNYEVYGPIVGEYEHPQMFGPLGNELEPQDVAVAPAYNQAQVGAFGEHIGDYIPTRYGTRRVGDWSYRSVGVPNRPGTIEMRDVIPDGNSQTPQYQAPFDPSMPLPGESAARPQPFSPDMPIPGQAPAPMRGGEITTPEALAPTPAPSNLPPEEANLYNILERNRVARAREGVYPSALPSWATGEAPVPQVPVRQPDTWAARAERNVMRSFGVPVEGEAPPAVPAGLATNEEYLRNLQQIPLQGAMQPILEQVPQPGFIEEYY